MNARGTLLLLLFVFVAGLLPFAWTFLEHYPDERNYTNAAITMRKTGEYVTPRWPDGHPNGHKPVLVYWVVAGSYALFGINLPASRLPFTLAGALIIALTFATARRLGASRDIAALAAAITFSQPQIILASMRAIPDVWLCLFLLLSSYGFLNLVVLERRTPLAYWAAYLGAALGVLTKGLLPLAFVAFAWLFAWIDRGGEPARSRLRALIHWPSMLVSLVVAGWWYVAMYALHGPETSRGFTGDQIGKKLAILDGTPLYQIPGYLAFLLINLFPWILLLAPLALRDPRSLVSRDPRDRRGQRFILLWGVLMAVIFGLGIKLEPRYILAAGPLFAIVLAAALGRADPNLVRPALRYLLWACLVVFAGFGLALSVIDASLLGAGPALLVLALFLAVAVAIALAARGPGLLPMATSVALAVFLGFPLAAIALRPALRPDAGVQSMAGEIERAPGLTGQPVLVRGPEWLANKLRLITCGRVAIDSWSPLNPARDAWPSAMVLPASEAAGLDLAGYQVQEISTEVRRVPVIGLLRAVRSGRVPEFLDAERDHYVVAIRR